MSVIKVSLFFCLFFFLWNAALWLGRYGCNCLGRFGKVILSTCTIRKRGNKYLQISTVVVGKVLRIWAVRSLEDWSQLSHNINDSGSIAFQNFRHYFVGFGICQLRDHKISLKIIVRPFFIATPWRIPLHLIEIARQKLDRMVQDNVIEPINHQSDYCAAMVVVTHDPMERYGFGRAQLICCTRAVHSACHFFLVNRNNPRFKQLRDSIIPFGCIQSWELVYQKVNIVQCP